MDALWQVASPRWTGWTSSWHALHPGCFADVSSLLDYCHFPVSLACEAGRNFNVVCNSSNKAHFWVLRAERCQPLIAQKVKNAAMSKQNAASSHSWPVKYVRLLDAGTSPLTATMPSKTSRSASTMLDSGRALNRSSVFEKDTRSSEK